MVKPVLLFCDVKKKGNINCTRSSVKKNKPIVTKTSVKKSSSRRKRKRIKIDHVIPSRIWLRREKILRETSLSLFLSP